MVNSINRKCSQNNGFKSGNKSGRVMILVQCIFSKCVLSVKFEVDSFRDFEVMVQTRTQSEN